MWHRNDFEKAISEMEAQKRNYTLVNTNTNEPVPGIDHLRALPEDIEKGNVKLKRRSLKWVEV